MAHHSGSTFIAVPMKDGDHGEALTAARAIAVERLGGDDVVLVSATRASAGEDIKLNTSWHREWESPDATPAMTTEDEDKAIDQADAERATRTAEIDNSKAKFEEEQTRRLQAKHAKRMK